MDILRNILFAPLSWLYATAVWFRNILYSEHLLPSFHVSIPTICVGNLAVGGTGKTPHVEYLIRLLSPHYKIAVLSRGYGRKTHGFLLADEQSTALTIGDEPMQIHTKFPDVPVAVCANRLIGIHQLQQRYPDLQAVLLDDAYQYRKLKCGMYILLTAADRLYTHDRFLPWGRLRDTREQSQRAHIIIVTKCPKDMQPIDRRIIQNTLHLSAFQNLYFSTIHYPSLKQIVDTDRSALIVTGIAHPEPLIEYIRSMVPQVRVLSYADHHWFNNKDIETLEAAAAETEQIFTTEKDYTRLATLPLSDALKNKLKAIPIEIVLQDKQDFDRQIINYIKENNHNK